ncbi:MAG: hypothetical protein ACYC61_27670 [Isosphaeraceae bacterium]
MPANHDIPVPDRDDDQAKDLAESDLTALERRLAAWQPAGGALDRDRMLYEAGCAAADSRVRSWQIGAAAMLLALAGLGGLLAIEHTQLARERALLAQERARLNQVETALAAPLGTTRPVPMTPAPPATISTAEPPAPDSYLALSSRLARDGAAIAWPEHAPRPAPEQPPNRPAEPSPRPVPLGPEDIRRALEL